MLCGILAAQSNCRSLVVCRSFSGSERFVKNDLIYIPTYLPPTYTIKSSDRSDSSNPKFLFNQHIFTPKI